MANKPIATSPKFKKKEEELIPWNEVVKDDIEAAGGSSVYFIRGARKEAGKKLELQ